MTRSYRCSLEDPSNSLVYLYEIRDAVTEPYGSEVEARKQLGISKRDWQRLGQLANDQPLLEGRHRGSQTRSLRNATPDELSEARRLASILIDAFAQRVSTTELPLAGGSQQATNHPLNEKNPKDNRAGKH